VGNQPTILFAGGGTGGHLYPGLSVAQALQKIAPDIRPLFLCTQRDIDRIILQPTGFPFITQPIVPPVTTVPGLLKFWKSWRESKDLIRSLVKGKPHGWQSVGPPTKISAILGLGGYAAGVAVKYCALHKIPAAILNQDVIPGKANQYLMRYVSTVCCQFEQTRNHVPAEHRDKLKTTGCPIRPEILGDYLPLPPGEGRGEGVPASNVHPPIANLQSRRPDASRRLELDPNLQTLVITGASQGAQTINEAVPVLLADLKLQGWQILHLAGREHATAVRDAYRNLPTSPPVRVIDFTPEMADIWAVADLAIARSGASTCAELCACGLPSILMPYPFHRDLHQRANAKVLADACAAILLDDEKDPKKNAAKLRPLLEPLLVDATRRRTMAQAAKKLAHPDAALRVAQLLVELAGVKTS
jgi:UDP-N-acetylglucosamine--N-acetylmuramyl-(pentapeptide) pyrophosphoryl-undecaprenol N-acetylglucosamine transferase